MAVLDMERTFWKSDNAIDCKRIAMFYLKRHLYLCNMTYEQVKQIVTNL